MNTCLDIDSLDRKLILANKHKERKRAALQNSKSDPTYKTKQSEYKQCNLCKRNSPAEQTKDKFINQDYV